VTRILKRSHEGLAYEEGIDDVEWEEDVKKFFVKEEVCDGKS
jgi:hypothetical protein